jgi:hypothetical protein
MNTSGKCPKCDAAIERIVIGRVDARSHLSGTAYVALTLQCPTCSTVLGVELERSFETAGEQPRGKEEQQSNTSH